jgi:hypothetical protein
MAASPQFFVGKAAPHEEMFAVTSKRIYRLKMPIEEVVFGQVLER